MTPEAKARIEIDRKLVESGYVVQDFKEFNPIASLGVAVREYPTSSGPVDYLIFINKIPCGVIEAKKTQAAERTTEITPRMIGISLSGILLFFSPIPIIYSTGIRITSSVFI